MNESMIRKMVAQVLREMHEANLEEDNLVSKEDLEESEEETIDEMVTPEEPHNDWKPKTDLDKVFNPI